MHNAEYALSLLVRFVGGKALLGTLRLLSGIVFKRLVKTSVFVGCIIYSIIF